MAILNAEAYNELMKIVASDSYFGEWLGCNYSAKVGDHLDELLATVKEIEAAREVLHCNPIMPQYKGRFIRNTFHPAVEARAVTLGDGIGLLSVAHPGSDTTTASQEPVAVRKVIAEEPKIDYLAITRGLCGYWG